MSLEADFPNLDECEITSPKDVGYNCIAWAAGDSKRWWQPDPIPGYYWPNTLPRDYSIEALINAYASLGFELCPDGSFEPGFLKIAIYSKDNEYQHAARQLPTGLWASKLGKNIDIEHRLDGLEGGIYGTVTRYLRRTVTA